MRAPKTALTLTAVAAVGPVLYPVWLLAATRRLPDPVAAGTGAGADDALSVVVAAYREAAVIREKVADLRANGWPGALEVVVVADDPETAAAARETGAVVVEPGRRMGKPAALALGVARCTADVVVITDANALLAPGSLSALHRWFADPQVLAVAGDKSVVGGSEGAYWRFEGLLKRRESRLGGTLAVVGELAAVRRTAWTEVPPGVVLDDMWIALEVLSRGGRLPYEPAARAIETASASVGQEWERRTRNVAGMLDVVRRRRALLVGHGHLSVQLWGHRLVRVSAGPLAHAGLLVLSAAGARRSPLARAVLAGHAAVAVAVVSDARGGPCPAPLRAAGSVGLLQLVGLWGTWRYVRGERPVLWAKPERAAL